MSNLLKTQLISEVIAAMNTDLLAKADVSDIITSYNDLADKPTIPTDISSLADDTNIIPTDISDLTDTTNLLAGSGLTQQQIEGLI